MYSETLPQLGEHITNNFASHFPVHTFCENHDYRIIAGNSSKEVGVLGVIDIIGNHAGMTRWGVYDH